MFCVALIFMSSEKPAAWPDLMSSDGMHVVYLLGKPIGGVCGGLSAKPASKKRKK
jgi:hypothetical protein